MYLTCYLFIFYNYFLSFSNNISIFSAVIPKYFINSSALPDFPKVSFIPNLINFVGYSSVNTSEIAVPKPPIIL